MAELTSRLRLRLRQVAEKQQLQIDRLVGEPGPLIRGSFGTRARVCGNPGCRCARGELHESKYLTASDGGANRQIHVRAAEEMDVQQGVERYRKFREMRAELAEIAKEELKLAEQLGLSLLKPYPPGNPLPPPKRRGRPKAGRGTSR